MLKVKIEVVDLISLKISNTFFSSLFPLCPNQHQQIYAIYSDPHGLIGKQPIQTPYGIIIMNWLTIP
jgi:hypothetical protein